MIPVPDPNAAPNDAHYADIGDHVYYRHPQHGVTHGRVTAHGEHGATCRTAAGEVHRIPWSDVLGHKQRQERRYKVLDRGEDGAIIEDDRGQRSFLAGDLPEEEEEDAPLAKSLMVDLGALPCACTNHALDTLHKAVIEGGDHDIWAPHENPFIRALVEAFTQRGLDRHQELQDALSAWLAGHYYQAGTTALRPTHGRPWTLDEQGEVLAYLRSVPHLSLDDWSLLIDYLCQQYLPQDALEMDGEWLAVKANLLGRAQAAGLENPLVAMIAHDLPLTVAGALQLFHYPQAEQAMLEYGRLRACENIVAMSDTLRHQIQTTVLAHMAQRSRGERPDEGKLQQELFDRFASANRDWRRIAVTEAGEIANQGFVASQPVGATVRRMEQYHGACAWCKKIDGRLFKVVAADDPNKDGDTDVWPGKTNIGRSASPRKWTDEGLVERTPSERYWVAAGTQHPHCRGIWIPMAPPRPGDDPEFAAWIRARLGQKEGIKG